MSCFHEWNYANSKALDGELEMNESTCKYTALAANHPRNANQPPESASCDQGPRVNETMNAIHDILISILYNTLSNLNTTTNPYACAATSHIDVVAACSMTSLIHPSLTWNYPTGAYPAWPFHP